MDPPTFKTTANLGSKMFKNSFFLWIYALKWTKEDCPLFKFCCKPTEKFAIYLPALSRYRVPYFIKLIFRVGDADIRSEVGIRTVIWKKSFRIYNTSNREDDGQWCADNINYLVVHHGRQVLEYLVHVTNIRLENRFTRLKPETWSRILERTISLRFLGMILWVLSLEVSVWIS